MLHRMLCVEQMRCCKLSAQSAPGVLPPSGECIFGRVGFELFNPLNLP